MKCPTCNKNALISPNKDNIHFKLCLSCNNTFSPIRMTIDDVRRLQYESKKEDENIMNQYYKHKGLV